MLASVFMYVWSFVCVLHRTFCLSVVPNGRISIKFGIEQFSENPPKSSKFIKNGEKVQITSRDGRSRLYCCRRREIAIKPLSYIDMVEGTVKTTPTRCIITLHLYCLTLYNSHFFFYFQPYRSVLLSCTVKPHRYMHQNCLLTLRDNLPQTEEEKCY